MDKDFRVWITPIPERQSEGKWDWRVLVQRLTDGLTRHEKVSGGWAIAESVARRLMSELGEEALRPKHNPPDPWIGEYNEPYTPEEVQK